MNAGGDRLAVSRSSNPAPLGRLANWLSSKLRARRARRMEEETLACLSTLEPSLLNDIGAHIGKISDSTLLTRKPDVVAANSQPPRRPRRREHS